MFKLSGDHLANFRGILSALEIIKGWIEDLRQRLARTESRLSSVESVANTIAPAAASSGGNAVYVTVDFGANFTHYATATVVGEAWVTATSKIVVTPLATVAGEEVEIPILSFQTTISDLVALTGFTLNVYTPIEAKGTYQFSCVGV